MAAKSRIITIYALVDPETHLVRYVGKTVKLAVRHKEHCSGADPATGVWVRSVSRPPQLLILETLADAIVSRPGPGSRYNRTGMMAETKWLKRFRRTVINRDLRDNSPIVWDWLTNPGERTC